jgi:hypothetical protein
MWVQLAAFAVGVWLTASPDVLGTMGPARASAHIAGPLAAMIGLIAAFEVTRSVRWLNLAIGAWLIIAPWPLGYAPADVANSTAIGLALAVLAGIPGRREESFGGGWGALWAPSDAVP